MDSKEQLERVKARLAKADENIRLGHQTINDLAWTVDEVERVVEKLGLARKEVAEVLKQRDRAIAVLTDITALLQLNASDFGELKEEK